MQQKSWKTDANGVLAFETNVFLLVVKKVGGAVRFLIFRRLVDGNAERQLLASGTEDSTRSAMAAAEVAAARFLGVALQGVD